MRIGRWLVGAALCAPAALAPAAASPGRPGKAVRIERAAVRLTGTPRLCSFTRHNDTAVCFGVQPEVGDVIVAFDDARVLGAYRVSAARTSAKCAPRMAATWRVSIEPDGAIDETEHATAGVIGVALGEHAHYTAQPIELAGHDFRSEVPAPVGVDVDGDGANDLVFAEASCDGGADPKSVCIEAWVAESGVFRRVRSDAIAEACL